MAEGGWIKLHRKFREWEWYSDSCTKDLFLHILLNATTKPIRYKGFSLEPGEWAGRQQEIADELGLTRQQIRTAEKHLISTNEITKRITNKFTIYKVENWSSYQDTNQQSNHQLTNNQPTTNQQVTRVEQEGKERKERKEASYAVVGYERPTREMVREYSEKIGGRDPDLFFDTFDPIGWVASDGQPIRYWRSFYRKWSAQTPKEQPKQGAKQLPDWYKKTEATPPDQELIDKITELQKERKKNEDKKTG